MGRYPLPMGLQWGNPGGFSQVFYPINRLDAIEPAAGLNIASYSEPVDPPLV
jgi:hypothetical protein